MRKQAQKLRNVPKVVDFNKKIFVPQKYGKVKLIVMNASEVISLLPQNQTELPLDLQLLEAWTIKMSYSSV